MGREILGPWMAARINLNVYLQINSDDVGLMKYYYSKKMRDFDIYIHQSCSYECFIKTMAHEMTHVRQYARRELREYKRYVSWRGRKIYIIRRQDNEPSIVQSAHGKMRTYDDFPWELDARNNELPMYQRYMKELEQNDYER